MSNNVNGWRTGQRAGAEPGPVSVHPECKPPLLDSPEASIAEVAWVAREARALMGATDDEPRCARFLARKRALMAYIETTTARRLATALTRAADLLDESADRRVLR